MICIFQTRMCLGIIFIVFLLCGAQLARLHPMRQVAGHCQAAHILRHPAWHPSTEVNKAKFERVKLN
jgi:hypothetical protein